MRVAAIKRDDFTPSDQTVICSEHFLPTDYKDDDIGYNQKKLKDDVVPSVFPAFPSHLQPPTKKRRILVRNSPEDASTSASADNPPSPIEVDIPQPSNDLTPSQLLEYVEKDHAYNFPSSIEAAKDKWQKTQITLESKLAKEKSLQQQLRLSKKREEKTSNKLKDVLADLENAKLLSSNSISILNGRFSDEQLKVVKEMLGKKSKGTRYS